MSVSVSDGGADTIARTERPDEAIGRNVGRDIAYIVKFVFRHLRTDPVVGIVLWMVVLGSSTVSSWLSLHFMLKSAATTNGLVARDHPAVVAALLGMGGVLLAMLLNQTLSTAAALTQRIRLRKSIVDRLSDGWFGGNKLYAPGGAVPIDYPEQRIQEDTFVFAQTTVLLIPMIAGTLTSFYLYSGELWQRATPYPIHLASGIDVIIPKALYVFAILSALMMTVITHLVGRILTRLDVVRQRLEAGFRHDLGMAREFGEQIVLSKGQKTERRRSQHNFRLIQRNWTPFTIISSVLGAIQGSSTYVSMMLPTLFMFPLIIKGSMKMGDLTVVAGSFGAVYFVFSSAVTFYADFAILRAAAMRLHLMEDFLGEEDKRGVVRPQSNGGVEVSDLTIMAPNGRQLAVVDDLRIEPGQKVLIKGRSGSGKSTLFRLLAGIWPFGRGSIAMPQGRETTMFLPQLPYMPSGSLREVLSYPSDPSRYDDADYRQVLRDVQLDRLEGELNLQRAWSKVLSPGEQQRICNGRALLQKPRYLFMDEGTSSLDAETEREVFAVLAERLSASAIVTISHTARTEAEQDVILHLEGGRMSAVSNTFAEGASGRGGGLPRSEAP